MQERAGQRRSEAVAIVDTTTMPWEPTAASRHLDESARAGRRSEEGPRDGAGASSSPARRMPTETLDRADGDLRRRGQPTATSTANTARTPSSATSRARATRRLKRRLRALREMAGADLSPHEKASASSSTRTPPVLEFPHRGADVLHLYRDTHGMETARIGNVHPNGASRRTTMRWARKRWFQGVPQGRETPTGPGSGSACRSACRTRRTPRATGA